MSVLHRGGMCHRFLPVPLSPGATMRIRGQGAFLRASIHISGPGRVQSACIYMHTRIHIYMHTPAHRRAAGLPQGSRLRRNAGAGPFCGPWHTPRAAASSVSGPTRFGPDPALRARGSPDRTHQASCCPRQPLAGMLSGGHPLPHLAPGNPWRGCSRAGIWRHTCPVVRPCVALARALAPPARAYPSDVVPPSRAPRRPPAGPPRPRNAPAQPQPRRRTGGRFRRGLGVMRARPRPRPGYGSNPSQKKM